METIHNLNPVDVAHGISNFGFMAITTAFYLVITAVIIIFFVKWFVKIINNIISRQEKTLDEIVSMQRTVVSMVKSINDGINDETLAQVKSYGEISFELSKYRLYYELKQIKRYNHLDGNEAKVREKIHSIVDNTAMKRSQKFDQFSYKGKLLSEYVDNGWVEKVVDICVKALYDNEYTNDRMFKVLSITYEEIINSFYKLLTH